VRYAGWRARDPSLVDDAHSKASALRRRIQHYLGTTDHAQSEAIVADRNRPQKHVWRAQIVLLLVDGT
jgi:hypothetical protein